jgi:sugar (pentulose or hexulose) kinase
MLTRKTYSIGVDISTQTVSAMLIGVSAEPAELAVSSAWTVFRPCGDDISRRTPSVWVSLVRECISDLLKQAPEAKFAKSIGVSTTFPGVFPIFQAASIESSLVSLYDNTDDAGVAELSDELIARAEAEIANRVWSGNMIVGLAHLVKNRRLDFDQVRAIVPPNTAFAYSILIEAGIQIDPADLVSDLTQCAIGGLYDIKTGDPMPPGVAELLCALAPKISSKQVRSLLPKLAPAWRNVLSPESVEPVRKLLGLSDLKSVSVGAGDSALGALALVRGRDTIVTVRGSTDSPTLLVDSPDSHPQRRENLLHFPLPTATSLTDSPWCAVAPTLRSGKVWDWVKVLGGGVDDTRLETLATEALKRRMRAPKGSLESRPLAFDTALGGERAPDWDPRAVGCLTGLLESHTIGDIALAALEGTSRRLKLCVDMMEKRYGVDCADLLLAGGCTHNVLWNWITGVVTGKKVLSTAFTDSSLLGAAMLGYASSFDGLEPDHAISERLIRLSRLSHAHPLLNPGEVSPPDDELAAMESHYTYAFCK